jgi:hypothetical protein
MLKMEKDLSEVVAKMRSAVGESKYLVASDNLRARSSLVRLHSLCDEYCNICNSVESTIDRTYETLTKAQIRLLQQLLDAGDQCLSQALEFINQNANLLENPLKVIENTFSLEEVLEKEENIKNLRNKFE